MYSAIEPFYEPGDNITGHTTTAVLAGRFAELKGRQSGGSPGLSSSANGGNYLTTYPAAGKKADGVYLTNAAQGTKTTVRGAPGAVFPVTTGGVIADGDEVEVGAAGVAIKLATGIAVGKAMVGAASGGTAEIRLY